MSATPCGKDSSTPRSATPCGIPGLQPSPDMLRVLGAPAKNPLGDITNTPQAVPSTGKKRKVKSEDTKLALKNYAKNRDSVDLIIGGGHMETYGDDEGLKRLLKRYKTHQDSEGFSDREYAWQGQMHIMLREEEKEVELKAAELKAREEELEEREENYEAELEGNYLKREAELEGKYQKKVQELESQYAAMAPGVNPKGYLTYRIKHILKREEEVNKREDALKKPKIASGALVFG